MKRLLFVLSVVLTLGAGLVMAPNSAQAISWSDYSASYYQNYFKQRPVLEDGAEVSGTFRGYADYKIQQEYGSISVESAQNYSLYRLELAESSEVTVKLQATMNDGRAFGSEEFVVYDDLLSSETYHSDWSKPLSQFEADGSAQIDKTFFLKAGTYYIGVHSTDQQRSGSYVMSATVEGAWDVSDWNGESSYARNHVAMSALLSPDERGSLTFSTLEKHDLVRYRDGFSFSDNTSTRDAANYALYKIELDAPSQITVDATVTYTDGCSIDADDTFILYGDMSPSSAGSQSFWSEKVSVSWDGSKAHIEKTFWLKRGTYYFGYRADKAGQKGTLDLTYTVVDSYEETFPEDQYGRYEGTTNNDLATARPIELNQTIQSFFSNASGDNREDYYSFLITEEGDYAVNGFEYPIMYEMYDVNGFYGSSSSVMPDFSVSTGGSGEVMHLMPGKYFIAVYASKGYTSDYGPTTFNIHKAGTRTVTFDSMGGPEVASQQVTEGGALGTLPADPIREGYRFVDWYLDQDFTQRFSSGASIYHDITLYAKWERTEALDVTYDYGFNSKVVTTEVLWGQQAQNRVVSRPGYVFAGWYQDASLTHPYDFSNAVTEDLTLYAKWVPESTDNAYELADFRSGDAATWTYPAKDGYAFLGWYVDETFDTPVDPVATSGTAYARFTKVANVIKFRGGGLRLTGDATITSGDMRLGYDIAVPEGAAIDWDASGWSYGTSAKNLAFSTTVSSYLPNGNGSYTANIVFANVPLKRFENGIYALAHVTYTTADGTRVTLEDTAVRSRSVMRVVSAILDDSSESTAVRDFAQRLRTAYDDQYSKYH